MKMLVWGVAYTETKKIPHQEDLKKKKKIKQRIPRIVTT